MAKLVRTKVEFEGHIREQEAVVEEDNLPVWTAEAALVEVGESRPRVDGPARVSGSAEYTQDVRLPGMLWTAILRSPHAHARISSIDVSVALEREGVFDVLTFKDTQSIPWYSDSFLLDRTLRFHGDEVACVAAVDEQTAQDALLDIRVTYETLHHVSSVNKAAEPTAPQIRPGRGPGSNRTTEPVTYSRGDVETAFASADVTVRGVYETSSALHNSFETHGSVARWEQDELTVWDSTQNIFGVRASLANRLSIPLSRVRVISRFMGGGFGSKNGLGKCTMLAAMISRRTGRPVRCVLDREAENLAAGHRPPTTVTVEMAAAADGTLAGIKLHSILSSGAYGDGGFQIGGPARELYQCKNVSTIQEAVYTNTGPGAAFRAPGYVAGTFALESTMDMLAERLGIDPMELRRKNYAAQNQSREMAYSQKHLLESYAEGARRIGWQDRRDPPGSPPRGKVRGMGMASQVWGGGGAPPSYALCRLNADGSFDVLTGTHDLGTGTKTVMTQIAAEELGVSVDRIHITIGDTLTCPYSLLSAGSLTVPSVGPTVRAAAADAKRQLLEIAGSIMDAPPDALSISDGTIHSGQGDGITVDEVAKRVGNYMIIGKGARGPNPSDVSVNTFGAQFAEVEVDCATGKIAVLRVVAAHEFGRVLNPLTLSSQIEGGVFQGMGYGVMEQRIVDESSGRVVNANLTEYKLPTMLDVPIVDSVFMGPPDEKANNTGAKGAGEPPIIPPAAAIANAVANAIGVRITRLPMTPQTVLEALETKRSEA